MQPGARFISLLFILLISFSACKTRRAATPSRTTSRAEPTSREYKELSKKLNLEVNNRDNIKLYKFIAEWIGVPHKDGGCDKNGTDCSCFVRMAYDHAYKKNLPRNSVEMYKQTNRVEPRGLKEGDLVFFRIKSGKVSHVGIYLKDKWFAHVSSSKGVMINNLEEAYYQKSYAGAGERN